MSASDRQLAGFESIVRSYLNINPEGELLREAHDITEELRMMIRIFTHQLSVMDLFSEHLAALHDKRRKPAPDEALDVLKDIKALLQQQSEGGETASKPTSNGHAIKDEVQRINEIINENATTLSSGAAHSNAISPQESKVPKPPPDIPETTISLSKRVKDHMTSRRSKLQELEEHTIIIAEQVRILWLIELLVC
jgi:small-conductance mechanosensitive channel